MSCVTASECISVASGLPARIHMRSHARIALTRLWCGAAGDLGAAAAQNQQGQKQIHRGPAGEGRAVRRDGGQRQQGDALHRKQR